MSRELDAAWTRHVLKNRGVLLAPRYKNPYLVCKVCGKDFEDSSAGLDRYVDHIGAKHPEYLTVKGRVLYESSANEIP